MLSADGTIRLRPWDRLARIYSVVKIGTQVKKSKTKEVIYLVTNNSNLFLCGILLFKEEAMLVFEAPA